MSFPPSAPLSSPASFDAWDVVVAVPAAPPAAAVGVAQVAPVPLHPAGAAAAPKSAAAGHGGVGSSSADDANKARGAAELRAILDDDKMKQGEKLRAIRSVKDVPMMEKMKAMQEVQRSACLDRGFISKARKAEKKNVKMKGCPRKKKDTSGAGVKWVADPCGHMSGNRSKKCAGCDTVFTADDVSELSLKRRKQREEHKKNLPYEKATKKARLAFLEQHFLPKCKLCQEVAGWGDPEGPVIMCKTCKAPVCHGCLKQYAQKSLEKSMVFAPANELVPGRHAKYFNAKTYGKWLCPAECGEYYTFPVFSGDEIGQPSLDATAEMYLAKDVLGVSFEAWRFKNDHMRCLEWKAPEGASKWDKLHAKMMAERKEAKEVNDEINKLWGKLVAANIIVTEDIGDDLDSHGLEWTLAHAQDMWLIKNSRSGFYRKTAHGLRSALRDLSSQCGLTTSSSSSSSSSSSADDDDADVIIIPSSDEGDEDDEDDDDDDDEDEPRVTV